MVGGDDITFAAWYRSEPGAAAPQPYLYIDWLDAVGAVIETSSAGPLGGGQPTSTWTRYELRAVAPAAAAKASFMMAAKAENGTGGGCLSDGMSACLTNGARYPSPANRGYANPAPPVTLSWEKPSGICSVHFGQNPAALDQVVANQEAQGFNHECIGSEHILLGLVQCDAAIGLTILKNLHVDVEHLRSQIDALVRESPDRSVAETIPRPHANEVVTQAIREVDSRQREFVDTAHILLGLLHQETSAIAQMLKNLGVTPETVREEILRLNQAGAGDEPPS